MITKEEQDLFNFKFIYNLYFFFAFVHFYKMIVDPDLHLFYDLMYEDYDYDYNIDEDKNNYNYDFDYEILQNYSEDDLTELLKELVKQTDNKNYSKYTDDELFDMLKEISERTQ